MEAQWHMSVIPVLGRQLQDDCRSKPAWDSQDSIYSDTGEGGRRKGGRERERVNVFCIKSPGAVVTGNCELPAIAPGNWTLVHPLQEQQVLFNPLPSFWNKFILASDSSKFRATSAPGVAQPWSLPLFFPSPTQYWFVLIFRSLK